MYRKFVLYNIIYANHNFFTANFSNITVIACMSKYHSPILYF